MKNNKNMIWFYSGILIGATSGIIAGSRLEKSGTINRILSEAEKMETELAGKGRVAIKALASGARDLSRNIRKNLSNPVPDLYKATESFTMSEQSGEYEW